MPTRNPYESIAGTLLSASGHHLLLSELLSSFGTRWPVRYFRELISQMQLNGRVTVVDAGGSRCAETTY